MPWELTGNGGTDPATNFLGTTDGQPLVIKAGNVGIGTTTPANTLHIRSPLSVSDEPIDFGIPPDGPNEIISSSEPDGPIDISRPYKPIGALTVDVDTFGSPANALNSHFFRVRNLRLAPPGGIAEALPPQTVFEIRGDGNVGIGSESFGKAKLEVAGDLYLDVPASSGQIGALTIAVRSFLSPQNALRSHFVAVRDIGAAPPHGATHFLIRGDGNVGIGTANPSTKLEVAGDIRANDLWLTSDAGLKADVAPVPHAMARLRRVRGVTFGWRTSDGPAGPAGRPPRRGIGVVAQEVERVFPELVQARGDGRKGVNYAGLTGVVVEALKELMAENDALRRRIDALERTALGGRVDAGGVT